MPSTKKEIKVSKWQKHCETYREMLLCYRIGKHPSESLLKRYDKANDDLRSVGIK